MLTEWSRLMRTELHEEKDYVLDVGTEAADVILAIDLILITADKRLSRVYKREERKTVVSLLRRWKVLADEAKQSLREVAGDNTGFFFDRAYRHVEDALRRDYLYAEPDYQDHPQSQAEPMASDHLP